MISAPKMTFSLKSPNILRPKVTKILRICLKKFCEFPPSIFVLLISNIAYKIKLKMYTLPAYITCILK